MINTATCIMYYVASYNWLVDGTLAKRSPLGSPPPPSNNKRIIRFPKSLFKVISQYHYATAIEKLCIKYKGHSGIIDIWLNEKLRIF